MKFDAYCATVPEVNLANFARSIAEHVSGFVGQGRPQRRFGQTLTIETGNRMAAWVGQDTTSGAIYIEAKGETTPPLVQAVREIYPAHSVPRLDVADDYSQPGAFEALQALVRAHKGVKVKAGYVALPDDVEDGRTWAAGVRGGVAYHRIYEAGKHPDRVHLAKPDWVRSELECRPHYARDKQAAASMAPKEVWGFTSWSHRVGEALTQCELARYEPEVRKYSHDKTTRYLANTFRRHFEEMFSNGEHLERTIRAVWEEEDAYKGRFH